MFQNKDHFVHVASLCQHQSSENPAGGFNSYATLEGPNTRPTCCAASKSRADISIRGNDPLFSLCYSLVWMQVGARMCGKHLQNSSKSKNCVPELWSIPNLWQTDSFISTWTNQTLLPSSWFVINSSTTQVLIRQHSLWLFCDILERPHSIRKASKYYDKWSRPHGAFLNSWGVQSSVGKLGQCGVSLNITYFWEKGEIITMFLHDYFA